MISPKTPKKIPTPTSDLVAQLTQLGLVLTADSLDDLMARAATGRWSPRQLLEEVARSETEAAARRSLERRLTQARLRRFKPIADFEWAWPKKIDRPLIERALTLDFLTRGRNLILCGTAGLGKTMIAKNIAHAAILAGHTALFRTVSDLFADLDRDSPAGRRRKFRFYARPSLLVLDEVGYLAYDAHASDLLFEIVILPGQDIACLQRYTQSAHCAAETEVCQGFRQNAVDGEVSGILFYISHNNTSITD